MNFLISNDDGYFSAGLAALAQGLTPLGDVVVVAPDRDRSGASNSLTLNRPLRPEVMPNGFIRVDGTPTDCVHLAITGLLDTEPDMVVSGINHGANLGDDVLYSGTVAAATEGRFLGLPAMAVSINSHDPQHLDSAVLAVQTLIRRLGVEPLPADSILNVNVPDLPWSGIRGIRATRLGYRHRAEKIMRMEDPRGRPVYWIGMAGPEQDAGPGTDFNALAAGYVSVTPLKIDLTRADALPDLAQWPERGMQ
ncbi:5'/3'-nucleotidase SurE [Acidihalobacter ferrooxydans]|uniref:5'-nucleotidase SurE n=1 Tax=Acidihalobacter ferrooxydans TaxID=1765967 RepID=A0A1P8UI54_9GAMM|nr:5'/3'-nucleotidase SurE [Acidihalobacter ferrooxydans]APZ43441.1 5'/3'-nucleotidase SurE [Acidihalobacter ferrooxydans]